MLQSICGLTLDLGTMCIRRVRVHTRSKRGDEKRARVSPMEINLSASLKLYSPSPASAPSHRLLNVARLMRRHLSLSKSVYACVQACEKAISLRTSSNTVRHGFLSTRRSAGTITHLGLGELIASAKYPTARGTSSRDSKSALFNCRAREPTTSASISNRYSSTPLVAMISGCPDLRMSCTSKLSLNRTWAATACSLYPNSGAERRSRRSSMQRAAWTAAISSIPEFWSTVR